MIPALIGLVSVAVAVLTWRATQLEEHATDKDRASIAETVIRARAEARAEGRLRDDEAAFTQYLVATETAARLRAQAAEAESAGLGAEAQVLEDRALDEEQAADTLALLTFGVDAVTADEDGVPALDVDTRRRELLAAEPELDEVDPDQAADDAEALRHAAERTMAFAVALVGVLVVLTVAQISRGDRLRVGLTAVGSVLFVLFAAGGLLV